MEYTNSPKEPDFFSQQVQKAARFYRDHRRDHAGNDIFAAAGGIEKCSIGYKVERSSFRYYGIEYVAAGAGTLVLGDSVHRLIPGSIFCYGPGVGHAISADSGEEIIKCFLDLTGKLAVKLLKDDLNLLGNVLHAYPSQTILQSFEELIQYGLSSSPYADRICSRLAEALILKMVHSAASQGSRVSSSFRTYQKCKDIIAAQFLELRSLQEAAEFCGVSPSYLCRLFSVHDHQTPYRFLQGLQMSFAADKMDREGLRIKEAAQLLGYDDLFHFSRTFKRIMGKSPALYLQHDGET